MPYRFRDHTADVAFEAWGGSLEEVFASSAAALIRTMAGPSSRIRRRESRSVEIGPAELDMLLWEFLQEIIFLKDSQRLFLLPGKLEIAREEEGYRLSGSLIGELIDPDRHAHGPDVKAVTLHQFRLERRGEGWFAFVILDV